MPPRIAMNLAEEYGMFSRSWRKSWSFRAWTIGIPALSFSATAGGLAGMFYTVYIGLYSVIFGLGVIVSTVCVILGTCLAVGSFFRKR
jgi:hypothetical protein